MVWTAQNRERYDRRGQRYPSDLTNEEWIVLEPLVSVPQGTGRPRRHLLREVMNGIRYVLRYGIPWDAMPKDLPPSSICYDYWRLLSDGGHMERINHHLVMEDREKAGREASPTLAIVDAQAQHFLAGAISPLALRRVAFDRPNGFDEQAVVRRPAPHMAFTARQNVFDPIKLVVAQRISSHRSAPPRADRSRLRHLLIWESLRI